MASGEFDYHKYLSLIQKHKVIFIVSALLIMTAATVRSYLLPNVYEARSTIFIEKSVISELLKGLTITPSADDKIRVLSYALNSRTLVARVLDELDLTIADPLQQEKMIKWVQDRTQIRILEREGLFQISFRDVSPKMARDYVNALVRRYIEENSSSKREESYGATKFVSEQLTALKEKLEKSEDAVNRFKAGSGAISTLDLGQLSKEINEFQQRLDEIRIREAQLKGALAGLGKVSSAQANIAALQRKLQELQLHYTDNYPEIQSVKDDIQALNEQLESGQGIYKPYNTPEYEKLSSELSALRQAESNLSASIARNRNLLQNVPAAKVTLDDLEREKNSQKSLYEALLAKEGQSEVSKQMEVQDKATVFRIVDPAVLPFRPVAPDRVKMMLMGILMGIGGGLGMAFLRDMADGSVKGLDMAKEFGFPVLAVIPRIEDPRKLAEQLRRDRLLYLAAGAYFSLILVMVWTEFNEMPLVPKIIAKLTS